MGDNQSDNSYEWRHDQASRDLFTLLGDDALDQKPNRAPAQTSWPKPSVPERTPTPQELEQKRRRTISDATHYLSAQDLKDFPTEEKYWGLKTETCTYDSGYGERGQPDMTTAHNWTITVFDTMEALEAWVLQCVERRETYRVVKAEPVKTEVKAVFSVVK